MRWTFYAFALVVVLVLAVRPALLHTFRLAILGRATVAERVQEHGHSVRSQLRIELDRVGLSYPPAKIMLLGLKLERELHLFAADAADDTVGWKFIKIYDVTAASGELGPKLREGDRQVPEGVYQIESLNPNSRFHLSLRLNYPNPIDRARAQASDRANLGTDIMIHGGNASIGCLAVGDSAIEELFVLAADTGVEDVKVILSPVDFRNRELPVGFVAAEEWIVDLHHAIRREIRKLPLPE